eukprot:220031_1
MAKEIIHVQIGQCGNQIGNAFWTSILHDHNLSYDGSAINIKSDTSRFHKRNVYFHELAYSSKTTYTPRACFFDIEPGILDVIKSSPIGGLYKPDNMIFGANSRMQRSRIAALYTSGAELMDEMVDVIRRETESCESLQGFQLTHSIAGYVGNFSGSLILLKLRDHYPDKITTTHSVFPSQKVSDVVIEPYNATLCIHQLLENADQTFVYDNEALFHISQRSFTKASPTYNDLNHIISTTMCGVTSSLRFTCALNSTLRRLGTNLIPFPRLHFFALSQAPFVTTEEAQLKRYTVPDLVQQLRCKANCVAQMEYDDDNKYLATSCLYRGDIDRIVDYKSLINSFVGQINVQYLNDKIVPSSLVDMCHCYCGYIENEFVKWIPDQNKSEILKIATVDHDISATSIANTTAIEPVFRRISTQFARMYKRKAFLHWFTGEGFDEMEFVEADRNVRDLITEYVEKKSINVIDQEQSEQ